MVSWCSRIAGKLLEAAPNSPPTWKREGERVPWINDPTTRARQSLKSAQQFLRQQQWGHQKDLCKPQKPTKQNWAGHWDLAWPNAHILPIHVAFALCQLKKELTLSAESTVTSRMASCPPAWPVVIAQVLFVVQPGEDPMCTGSTSEYRKSKRHTKRNKHYFN